MYFEDYSICYEGICFYFEDKHLDRVLINFREYLQLKVLGIKIFPKNEYP
jgi:hypothetical protein